MNESRLRFSLLESLLLVALFSILWALAIQMHRQHSLASPASRPVPWPTLIAFAVWLAAWLGGSLRASRRQLGDSGRVALPGELLLAGAATSMIANGVGLILLSRGWSVGAGPDPIRTLFWLTALFLLLALGAAATIFYRPMRRRIFYWLLSLFILGAVALHNVYALAQALAAV